MDAQTTEPPAAEATPEATAPEVTDQHTAETSVEPEMGDAGKKALKAERDARKIAEKELAALRSEVTKLREPSVEASPEPAVDVEAIKSEIRAEYAAQLAEAAIKAEAKGRLTDPADALLYIKAADVDTSDEAAVTAAVDALLESKPYLGADQGPKPWGDVGGGQRTAPEPEPKNALERMARAYGTPA